MRPIRAALLVVASAVALLPTASLAQGSPTVDGEFFYVDRNESTFDKHKSTTNISIAGNDFCFGGELRYVDTPSTPPNRRVDVNYSVLGTIAKADGDEKVQGDFSASNTSVTIDVLELRPQAEGGPTSIFLSSTTVLCRFEGRAWVSKGSNFDRMFLLCDITQIVGDLLADPDPSLLGNVTSALARKKNIKLDLATNTLTIRHTGVVKPDGPVSQTLSCPIPP